MTDALGLNTMKIFDDYYLPRLYCGRTIYLNRSNGKWLLIGSNPCNKFAAAVYLCGSNGHQIRIPIPLPKFIEKVTMLQGVASGSATSIHVESEIGPGWDISIAKADFGEGVTYKVSGIGTRNTLKAVYIAASSLKYLVTIEINIYDRVVQRQAKIQDEFENVVDATVTKSLDINSLDFHAIEEAMFSSPPPDIDMNIYSEALCNFRNFYYREVREAFGE